mmetsp:Transcript_2763/g.5006  ORF Transcript_2763/g.5006 Transcript_2763/m.5006 type:complete len:163 (-) Transcript_2763:174-662(-)
MTMDHDYDWKFQVSRNRIKVEARMIKQPKKDSSSSEEEATNNTTTTTNGGANTKKGLLYFTAGFDIQRSTTLLQQPSTPTYTYPLQLARVIIQFPIYCFVIQLWIHYEAFRLLMKGVEFIPHPQGSETGASRAIGAVMRPVFAVMDGVDVWWKGGGGKRKGA